MASWVKRKLFCVILLWGLLKTPKSRLATDEKAEFTIVNEHFEEGV